MPTQREKFTSASFGVPPAGAPIPEFPKLPEFLRKKAVTEADKKDLEKFEADIAEFFKKGQRSGSL
jgi:hypothetical protein